MLSKAERSAHWARLVSEQGASGVSMASWCRNQNIAVSTLDYWKRRLKSPPSTVMTSVSPEWLSVSLAEPVSISQPTSDYLSVRVGKVSVEVPSGFNCALLGDILTVLEDRC
jgi:hypothetical protein